MGLGNVGTSPDSDTPLSLVMKHGEEENSSLFFLNGKIPPFLIIDPLALDRFPDNTNVG